jgi:ubiquinone/menaquinone biosynthesis C-methylase UbiE
MQSILEDYLLPGVRLVPKGEYYEAPIEHPSPAIEANAFYFGNTEWAQEYLDFCHRTESFKERWQAAMGDWTGKTVVDIGCGPGNVYATLGGKPGVLIGLDVAPGSLELAAKQGYTAIRADAQHVPLRSEIADIVVINASIHHCQDMNAVILEAARLVKPGGLLITDHDPQRSAWDFKGPAKLLWNARLLVYRVMGRGFHKTLSQQSWGLATEIHHKPGHGVSEAFYRDALEPLGFEVSVHPHNHETGAEVLKGDWGKAELKYRVGNLLSGRNPEAPGSALSLMCVARRSEAMPSRAAGRQAVPQAQAEATLQ